MAGLASAFVTGVTSGDLGQALRAGFISAITAVAFNIVGDITLGPGHKVPDFGSTKHLANIAGHAAVGCLSAVASGGKCGAGALAAGVAAAGGPLIEDAFPNPRSNTASLFGGTAASAVLGGLGSVAGGGKFANGAVTGAFGYLFNQAAGGAKKGEEQIKYDTVPDHPFVMTEEFRRTFAGSQQESDLIGTIAEIEAGTRKPREQLKPSDLQLPGKSGTFYEIFSVGDGWGPERIARIPGSNVYFYSPYHYSPGPGAPNVWFLFTINRCTVRGIC